MLLYVNEFVIFAFCGWIVDSTYSSFSKKKLTFSGYFPGVPLCPLYGFGGILLMNSFLFFENQPFWITIILTTMLITLLEYVGGRIAERLLDERLWDYSKERFNLHGYISVWHSFLWFVGVSLLYRLFNHHTEQFLSSIEPKIHLNAGQEVLLFFFILLGALWATAHTKKLRLARLAEERLLKIVSMEDFFDIDRWHRLADEKKKELLSSWNSSVFVKKLQEWERKQ